MADKPPEDQEKSAEAEFQRVLGNLAKMPPKPHKPKREPENGKPSPKR
ncbi:MAG: hypothetical protein K0R83_178 [Caulobacter sp.]|nr:hypothetical protein [Caulobacter sp.]